MRSTWSLVATLSLTTFVSAQNFASYYGTKSFSGSYDINPTKNYTATTLTQCQNYCANEAECYLASWDSAHNRCYLCSGQSCYGNTPLEAGHGKYWTTSLLGTCAINNFRSATTYNSNTVISLSASSLACTDSGAGGYQWAIYDGFGPSNGATTFMQPYSQGYSLADCRSQCEKVNNCACAYWDGVSGGTGLCTLQSLDQCTANWKNADTRPYLLNLTQVDLPLAFASLYTSCSQPPTTNDGSAPTCAANFDPCPAGQYGSYETSCNACPLGTTSTLATLEDTQCTLCPSGTYGQSVDNYSTCQACPTGFYSSSPGQPECSLCVGASVPTLAADACISCSIGQIAGPSTGYTCQTCADGFAPRPEGDSCAPCALGTAGTGGICTTCPTGSTTSTEGLSTCDVCDAGFYLDGSGCVSCPDGFITLGSGATSRSQCTACPFGTYAVGNTCNSCELGYYTNGQASTAESQCLPAEFGFYSDTEGTLLNCPDHSNTTNTGSISITDCLCDIGYFMNSNNECQTCASFDASYANRTTLEIGATSSSQCVGCPMNSYLTPDMSCSACDSTQTSLAGSTSCVDLVCGPRMLSTGTVTQCLPDVGQYCAVPSSKQALSTSECYSGFCGSNGLCADAADSEMDVSSPSNTPLILASHNGSIVAGSLTARGTPLELLLDSGSAGNLTVERVVTLPASTMRFPPITLTSTSSNIAITGIGKSIQSAGDFVVTTGGSLKISSYEIYVIGNMLINAGYTQFTASPDVIANFATFTLRPQFSRRTPVQYPTFASFTGTLGHTNVPLRIYGGEINIHGCQTTPTTVYNEPSTCDAAPIFIADTNEIAIYSGNVVLGNGTFAQVYGPAKINNVQGGTIQINGFPLTTGVHVKRDINAPVCLAISGNTIVSTNTQCGNGLSPDGHGGCLVNLGGNCGCNTDCVSQMCSATGTCIPKSTSAPKQRKARRARIASRFGPRTQDDRCPAPLSACELAASSSGGFECVNLFEELESCGACGHSCLDIPGAQGVACSEGECIISTCAPGFLLRNNECIDRYD